MGSDIDMLSLMLARAGKERSRATDSYKYGRPADSRAKFQRENMDEKDEVGRLLDMWADWMHKPEPIADGYPAKASGGFIESWRKDAEDEDNAAEARTIEKVNAAFDSLPRIYQEAINRHYGLGYRVWRFDRDVNLEDAKIVIRVKFVAKGLL